MVGGEAGFCVASAAKCTESCQICVMKDGLLAHELSSGQWREIMAKRLARTTFLQTGVCCDPAALLSSKALNMQLAIQH